ncbi:hypothetical protein DHEL01_v202467 [Diaporthe helianthi]|uniref:Uncharacterized protein n=1 Tax=Diaporthe helianthi TaxID=158607 RepID=A0A2P5I9G1_DIAHE|nr:hypothetical protein DHEL01_v202467 [Diaporthe helianthi]
MLLMVVLIIGLVTFIEHPWISVHESGVGAGTGREIASPEYPTSPVPEEQLYMTSEDTTEVFVAQEQEGQLQDHNNKLARRNSDENQMAERDPAVHEQRPPPIKLPKLPIPSEILDLPIEIPTHVSDILSDLPLPTFPTDPGDIFDGLPTDPGEIFTGIPIPTVPTAPPVPFVATTPPVPVLPIPPGMPGIPTDLPLSGADDIPYPLPTILPPSNPRVAGDGPQPPSLIEIPHKILGLLHHAVSQLSNNKKLPQPVRDTLRLIQRIIERLAGGLPVPAPNPTTTPSPTIPLPIIPPLPTITTTTTRRRFPPFPPHPRPTLTRPVRARQARDVRGRGGGDGDDEKRPLTDGERKQLREAVRNEVWYLLDWTNPIEAPLMAAAAMLAFDSIYLVAEASKGMEDEAELDKLMDMFVVVDDDDVVNEEVVA